MPLRYGHITPPLLRHYIVFMPQMPRRRLRYGLLLSPYCFTRALSSAPRPRLLPPDTLIAIRHRPPAFRRHAAIDICHAAERYDTAIIIERCHTCMLMPCCRARPPPTFFAAMPYISCRHCLLCFRRQRHCYFDAMMLSATLLAYYVRCCCHMMDSGIALQR